MSVEITNEGRNWAHGVACVIHLDDALDAEGVGLGLSDPCMQESRRRGESNVLAWQVQGGIK